MSLIRRRPSIELDENGPILTTHGLSVSYGTVSALEGVDISVDRGECVAVLGANGAGKTTLLKALSGGVRIRSGEARLGGVLLNRLAPHHIVRMGIAHVPEGRQVLVRQTVGENLELAKEARRGTTDADIDDILEVFPALRQKLDLPAGSLSGGQQQMLAIARAVLQKPSAMLLDEPSLGLSPTLMEEVTLMLRRLQKERGLGFVLVEQNVYMAAQLTTRAYVLQRGSVIAEMQSSELLGNRDLIRSYLGGASDAAPATADAK